MALTLDDLKERARAMTREALQSHPPLPEGMREKLTLGIQIDGRYRVFELYLPGERPSDAKVLSRVRLHVDTGEGGVEVFPELWRDQPPS